ncbi:unnamed protein product [Cyclocybe aegerita]|uniref:Zinc-finger domain-containing protein n=1 Tax=Cyclocybe aegerita TaxID=1973307 RepID=A0A8S0WRG5_CYCAE|nr:unnamed protein product [Cyclocybe aegerita]
MSRSYTLGNWDGGLSSFGGHSREQLQVASVQAPTAYMDSLENMNTIPTSILPSSHPHMSNGNFGLKEAVAGQGSGPTTNGDHGSPEALLTPTTSSELARTAAQEPISLLRDNAPIHPITTDASNTLEPPKLAFVPIANSPLFQTFTPRTRKPPSIDTNTSPTPVGIVRPLNTNTKSLRRDSNASEPISIHTEDAEGEEDDDDVIVVDHLLVSACAPTAFRDVEIVSLRSLPQSNEERSEQSRTQSSHSGRDSLFTPPPSSDGIIPLDRLFTPDPPNRRGHLPVIPPTPSPPPPRLIMSHIQVPPLRRPKSEYVWLDRLVGPPKRAKKPNIPSQGPSGLRDALQAAWSNNLELGTEPVPEGDVTRKKRKKNERREGHLNAVAGPSSLATSSSTSGLNMEPKVFKYEGPKKERRQGDGSEKRVKRPRITIDLTVSDEDRLQKTKYKPLLPKQHKQSKQPPPPSSLPVIKKKPARPVSCLMSDVIIPVPSQVLAFNTRFIWRMCGKENISSPSHDFDFDPWSISSWKRTSLCSVEDSSSYLFDEDEAVMSVGGTSRSVWEEDFRQPAEGDYDSDDSSVVVIESLPREQVQPVPPPPPPQQPPQPPKKIDLAEQFRKKKKAKQKQVPSPLSKKQRSSNPQPHRTPSSDTLSYPTPASSIHVQSISSSVSIDSDSNRDDASIASSYPSAKALGKRKAISPPLSTSLMQSFRPCPSSSLSVSPRHAVAHPNGNLDVFIHPYASPLDALADYRSGSASTEEQADPVYNNHHRNNTPSSPDLYQAPDTIAEAAFLTDAMPPLNDFETIQTELEDPWASLADSNLGYKFDTIDPTLLGGEPVVIGREDSPSVAGQSQSQAQRSWVYTSSLNVPPSPSSSSTSLSSSSSSKPLASRPRFSKALQDEGAISTPTTTPDGLEIEDDGASTADIDADSMPEMTADRPRRRKLQRRRLADMVPIDEIDTFATTTTSEYRSSSSSDEEVSQSVVSSRIRRPTSKVIYESIHVNRPVPEEVKRGVPTKTKPFPETNWPTTKNDAYCHQCRRKTFLVKLYCSECTKLFCVRCLTNRYPDQTFDTSKATRSCPYCEGYCNCTVCCKKRGAVYVSSRKVSKNPFSGEVIPVNQPIQRTTLGGKTNLPPPVTFHQPPPQPPPQPANAVYWGTVYDLSGKRIGRSYFDPKAAASHVHVEKPVDPTPFAPRKPAMTARRMFVGKIQRSWGLGQHPKFCEFNPPARAKKSSAKREPRRYIGDKKFLSYRFYAEGSSLSSMEEDETDDDDNGCGAGAEGQTEGKETFSPNSLGDEDIARAIGLALSACGWIVEI